MSTPAGFVDGMRRRARRAYRRSSIIQIVLATGLVAYGFYFPSFCGDCDEHPLLGWLLAGGMVIGGIAWIVGVIRGVLKRRTPSGDPLNLQLHACGDPAAVASELEQEFAGQTFRPKRVYVGGHWLCFEHKTQVTVRRIDALVWAYVERVRHKLNGVTPMGTTNQLIVWSRDGRGAAIPLKRKAADEALKTLQAAAPWIFAGYSEALKESWNNDRDDFIALVDEARRQNGRAAPQGDPH